MESEKIMNKTTKRIPTRVHLCFISGMIAGLLTHFYMLTHKIPNWDDITVFSFWGQGRNIGRWFLKYIDPLGGRWSLPAIHGVLTIIFLSGAACFITEILELKRKISVVLVPLVMVTFPSLASTMYFMYIVHDYALAVMFMCLSVYVLRRFKYGYLLSIVLIVVSLATYQPYVSFAIGLMLMSMLADMLRGKKNGKETLKAGIKYAAVLLISVGLYMILCRIFYPNISEEAYGGVGKMGQIPLQQIPRLIGRCYKRFLEYFLYKPASYVSSVMQTANILVCIGIGGLFLCHVITQKLYKDKLRGILLVLVAGLIPFALAFVYFMAPDAPYSILMTYAYVLVYIVLVMLLEMVSDNWRDKKNINPNVNRVQKVVVAVISLSILTEVYTGYLITNEAYFRSSIAYERTVAFFNRILANVEQQEGFAYGDKVALLGEFYYVDNPSPIEINLMEDDRFREMSGVALENGLVTSGVRDNFIRMYLGFELPIVTNTEKEQIMKTEIYQAMPSYPTAGCIKKIEDVWVVKMCDQ